MKRLMLMLAMTLATMGGAGAVFGQSLATLDEPEQMAMSDTFQYALENNPSNEVSNWVNPDTGHSGAVVPVKTYTNELGQPCREFVTTIVIGGQEEQGYGTACRQPDGSWQIVADEQTVAAAPAPANVYVYSQPERHYYIYPESYYYYPASFYYPYPIYLSFHYIFRSGHVHFGTFYLDGPRFRHRHPVHVRSRIYVGPRIFTRHHWYHRSYRHAPVHRKQFPTYQKRYDYRRPDNNRLNDRERFDYRQRRDLSNRDHTRQLQRQQRPPAVRQPTLKREQRSPVERHRIDDGARRQLRVSPQVRSDHRRPDANRQGDLRNSRDLRQSRDLRNGDRTLRLQRQQRPSVSGQPVLKWEQRSPIRRDRQSFERTRRQSVGVRQPSRTNRQAEVRQAPRPRQQLQRQRSGAGQSISRQGWSQQSGSRFGGGSRGR